MFFFLHILASTDVFPNKYKNYVVRYTHDDKYVWKIGLEEIDSVMVILLQKHEGTKRTVLKLRLLVILVSANFWQKYVFIELDFGPPAASTLPELDTAGKEI